MVDGTYDKGLVTVQVHLGDDTRIIAERGEHFVWISVGSSVTLHIRDIGDLEELAGAIDQASHLLDKDL